MDISVLGIALLGISILAQRIAHRRRSRAFQAAVREAAELGGRVDPPARDLAVLAGSVNELLEAMSARQLEAQRASEAMNAERAAASAERRETEARAERERLEAAAKAAQQRELDAAEARRLREIDAAEAQRLQELAATEARCACRWRERVTDRPIGRAVASGMSPASAVIGVATTKLAGRRHGGYPHP